MSKRKIVMFVYGDITTDARVQRSAKALCDDFEVIVISEDFKKPLPNNSEYRNVLVGKSNGSRLNYFRCVIDAIKIIKDEKPDIVYGHDYYSAAIIRFFLPHKYCKKTVYDAHELYIPERGRTMTLRSLLFYRIEKSIVNRVDVLFCANEKRGSIMAEHYGLERVPKAIHNISQLCLNDDDKTKDILSSLESFWRLPGKTVVYAGAMIGSRHLDILVKAVASLAPDYKLLMLGKGDSYDSLKELAASFSNMKSLFVGAVPYSSLGAILSRCDIGYLYYPVDTLNNIYCASNKIYEYASVCLPILANQNPTILEIIEEGGIGIATDDLQMGLFNISKSLELFKKNCELFNRRNPWAKDEELLRNTIKAISYES